MKHLLLLVPISTFLLLLFPYLRPPRLESSSDPRQLFLQIHYLRLQQLEGFRGADLSQLSADSMQPCLHIHNAYHIRNDGVFGDGLQT